MDYNPKHFAFTNAWPIWIIILNNMVSLTLHSTHFYTYRTFTILDPIWPTFIHQHSYTYPSLYPPLHLPYFTILHPIWLFSTSLFQFCMSIRIKILSNMLPLTFHSTHLYTYHTLLYYSSPTLTFLHFSISILYEH